MNSFLISICSYKTILITKAVSAIGVWCLLHWTVSVGLYKFAIVLKEFYYCCEVAYVSYIFDKVSKDKFLTVSALTRAAPLAGHMLNALLFSSILRNINPNIYIYLALLSQIAVLIIAAIFLNFNHAQPSSVSLESAPSDMIQQVQTAFSNQFVVFYSIWYIFGFGIICRIITNLEDFMLEFHSHSNDVSVNLGETNNALLNDLVIVFECFVHEIDDLAWLLHSDCIGIEYLLCGDVSTDDIPHSTQTEHSHLSGRSVFIVECINFFVR